MEMALPDGSGGGPFLEIINHTSLFEEKVTKYGQTYDTHVVVKNSPFVITLSLRNCRTHDFNHLGARVFRPSTLFRRQLSPLSIRSATNFNKISESDSWLYFSSCLCD